MRATLAAKIFLALAAIVVAFQVALVAGAPWGELTMGGGYPGRLPPRMRIAALGSAVLLVAFGAIVAARSALAFHRWYRASRWLMWVVVAYTIIGVALNAMTRSVRERAVWLPVAVALAASALVVALSSRPGPPIAAHGGQTQTDSDPNRV
jgi:hypothetical protein